MNEMIRRGRDVALGLLKADEKTLEHGLEIHRDSVVCDAYGFAPRASMDGDVLRRAIEAGASRAELREMNEDMLMTRYVRDPVQQTEFKEAFDASGVTCILENAGEECQAPLRIIRRLAHYTYVCDTMPGYLPKAVKPDDIIAAHDEGRHCLYLTCNAVPLAQQWVSVEEELQYIRIFFQLGCRMMHLTYNRRNMIGDGCAEPSNAGLSDFGRAVVAEMSRQGVIVDVAHSGWRTSEEAAKVSQRPVVASHSGCCALNEHMRCKPDEVIRAIADSGGYIGICCVPSFLGGTGDIRAMLDHIDHAARTFGVDHVAIGTDTAYFAMNIKEERARMPKLRSVRPGWASLWPERFNPYKPEWKQEEQIYSMLWTNWPLFTVGLVQRGYSDEDIRKIIGGNVIRVARSALDGILD